MTFTVNDNYKTVIENDLHKKYLNSGKRLSGSIKDDKIILFLEDDFGKHSAFMSHYFYGKTDNNRISGTFRLSNFVVILLAILFVFALESLIAAILLKGYSGIFLPSAVIIAEVVYFFFSFRISEENNELIKNYISSL